MLGKGAPVTLPDFVAGVRRNVWHNMKCFLIFLLLAGATIGVWFAAAHAISRKVFDALPPGASSTFLFRAVVALGALLLYAVFSLLHDFARAARRSGARIGAWRAYGHALRVLAGRWPRALGIFLFWFLFGGALLLLAIGVEWSAPAISAVAIALHILLQIAVLAIRPAIRIAAWGSYLALYDRVQPTLAPPAVVLTPPPESLSFSPNPRRSSVDLAAKPGLETAQALFDALLGGGEGESDAGVDAEGFARAPRRRGPPPGDGGRTRRSLRPPSSGRAPRRAGRRRRRSFRRHALHAGSRREPPRHDLAPPAVVREHVRDRDLGALEIGERGPGGLLRDRGGVGRRVALVGGHRRDQLLAGQGPSQPPARHRVRLRRRAGDDDAVLVLLPEGSRRDVPAARRRGSGRTSRRRGARPRARRTSRECARAPPVPRRRRSGCRGSSG